jgi:hypothetical protein
MKNLLSTFLIFISFFASAQIGGNAVYKFLNLSASAKQTALGGKVFSGLKSDIFQPAFNPATLDSTMNNKLGVNYVSYLSDINYGNIAYARNLKKLGTVYAAVSYVNYGSFDYASEDGTRNGTFGASEAAVILGYAYKIDNHFSLGANSKFILSNLEQFSSSALAFDLGFLYKNEEKGLQSALVFRNMGWQLSTYQGVNESLPFEIDFSFSKTFLHAPFKWFVTFENLQKPEIAFVNTAHNTQDPNGKVIEENISFGDHLARHTIIGLELFPKKRFNARVGYSFRRGAELGLKDERFGAGLNFGFGLQLRKFEINYAYGSFSNASNAGVFSVIVNLDEF